MRALFAFERLLMRRLIVLLVIGVIGAAALLFLGSWQVERLHWKQAILAEIEGQIYRDPVAVPANPDPEADRFLAVTAHGRVTEDEILVLASARGQGAGYRVISAFETDDGRRLMLDRGFVGITAHDDVRPAHDATIIANLHWPEERDSFTPENDLAANTWFARDVPQMAQVLKAEPFLLVLRETDYDSPRVTPWPVDTSGIPNNHLEYAVTWFSFAAIWVVGIGFILWQSRRTKNERPD